MSRWEWYVEAFLSQLPYVLPWVAGWFLVVGITSMSAIGQALIEQLRDRRAEEAWLEELAVNVAWVRREVVDLTERLDVVAGALRKQEAGQAEAESRSGLGAGDASNPEPGGTIPARVQKILGRSRLMNGSERRL